YSPRGEILVGLTHSTYGVAGLVRMQVVQDSLEYIKVNIVQDLCSGGVDTEKLLRNLRDFVPPDMKIEINIVDDIERLPSGKTPFVIQKIAGDVSFP
ncbi:hypothetical protein LNV08_22585, partial [Paucibacter sp. TC2R-5]|uniref:hypothetical protein n=1 Tax=Paucibacter sp. TC2R-5 TaxID=2893555 RepID=UPI0021E38A5E